MTENNEEKKQQEALAEEIKAVDPTEAAEVTEAAAEAEKETEEKVEGASPAETAETSESVEPAAEASNPVPKPVPDLSTYAFRWDYSEQKRQDGIRRRQKTVMSVLSYTLVVMGIFACAFLMLSSALSIGGTGGTTVGGGSGGESAPTIDQTYGDHIIFVGDGSTAGEDATLESAAAKALPSAVGILVSDGKTGSGVGSGFIYTADGYIVTNHHVIDGMTSIVVQIYGGKRYPATVVGTDELSDLAVLKIDATGLIPATLGQSKDLMVAESVLAIGSPIGINYTESVSRGIVSSRRRAVKVYDDSGKLQYTLMMIQIDNAVNPGNSGGPLVNRKGEVVGVVSKKVVYSNIYADGMGLVIPIDEGKGIIDALIAKQAVDRSNYLIPAARLGISGENVKKESGYAADGVRVTAFTSDRFDAAAKLAMGDLIVAIEGISTTTVTEILRMLEDYAPGTTVEISVVRNGQVITLPVTLGSDALAG